MGQSVPSVLLQPRTLSTDDEPVIPILLRRYERLSQPTERYSPVLFYTNSSEPTIYEEAKGSTNYLNGQLAMESEMNSIYETILGT